MDWTDVQALIELYTSKEGTTTNVQAWKALANIGLDEFSRRTGLLDESSWSSATLGGLTIVGRTVALPTNLVEISSVLWDGEEIYSVDAKVMDYRYPEWREATGRPELFIRSGRQVLLDKDPTGLTGALVIYGIGMLPHFVYVPAVPPAVDDNPLEQMPQGFELITAWYVLWKLPADPDDGLKSSRKMEAKGEWDQAIRRGASEVRRLRFDSFR